MPRSAQALLETISTPISLQGALPFPATGQGEIFRRIRNFLAGRVVGATRDKALLAELIKCIFCKAYMAQHGVQADPQRNSDLIGRYRATLELLHTVVPNVIRSDEKISLDDEALTFVDEELGNIDFSDPDRDPLGDAYEAFAGSSLRRQEGQFFTPLNAIDWLVHAVGPTATDKVIDPACGAGGFLSSVARHKIKDGATPDAIAKTLFGVEKDLTLAKLAATHISIFTLHTPNIICGDLLALLDSEKRDIESTLLGQFDIVLSNPPFGTKIISTSDAVRRNFELGYKWIVSKQTGRFQKTRMLQTNVPPQILFIERIIGLLRRGGRMGVVLPESVLSNSSYAHVVQYLKEHLSISAIVGMPEELFKSPGANSTHTKACLLVAEKKPGSSKAIYMAEVKWCGHDSRGKTIPHDEIPKAQAGFRDFKQDAKTLAFGYSVSSERLNGDILCPRYYDPSTVDILKRLAKTHDLATVGELADEGLLSFSSGHEVGKLAYGTGTIPFVRTSDISNWEIKSDPKHCVSEEIYQSFRKRQNVQEGDILFVRDGTYLIGSCGFISKYDTKVLYQSHIYKIRCLDWEKMSPYLLLATLSCEPVIGQIKAKRFTQDIIDSIGNRVFELVLPIPKDKELRRRVESVVKKSIEDRIEARELARQARVDVCSPKW